MRHLRNIVLAIIAGVILAGIMSQFTSSKPPPCDLVVKGIAISTYSCSDSYSSTYPCRDEPANSKSMANCIQQNYYRERTFPFGFKQHFGPDSNLIDKKPKNENFVASFVLGFTLTISVLYIFQAIKSKPSHSEK